MKRCVLVRFMLVVALLVLVPSLTLAQPGAAPRIYSKHFIFGYPLGASASNPMIIRDLYALSMNGQTKLADWVCYHLTPHETQGTLDLDRKWRNDPWLQKDETLVATPEKDDDYSGVDKLKYNRGHMAPLASFKGSRFASQVNFYSNILPQKADMNAGPWGRLEDKVRGLVDKYGQVWGMSGPLYEKDMPPLPKTTKSHKVPSGFWMIVVASDKETPGSPQDLKVAAFIMGQDTPRTFRPAETLVAVEEVEKRAKLDFFWQLSAADQKKLESQKSTAWVQEWLD